MLDLKTKTELRLKVWLEKLETAKTQTEFRQAQAVVAELKHLLATE